MTLDEIASHVTSLVGQTDATSLSLCKDFVKRRYQLIYDAHHWRDSQIISSATVTEATNSVAMPATMDRVIGLRANDRRLDPVDANFLLETDPTIFERSGVPSVYEEWTDPDASNAKKIKVYPTPTVNTALLIVGKRIRPELVAGAGAGSSPILRNIDNALIAYATHDMLRRQRQYAKAAQVLEEASALLEAAKVLETQQANRPRRAKGLTASGNSLAEMADAVCARCGTWNLDHVILAKDFLRRCYAMVWDANLWTESTVVARVTSGGTQIVLPSVIDRVLAVRSADNHNLGVADTVLYFQIAPTIFEQTGTPYHFSILAPAAVSVLPPGRERLKLVSSSPQDKGNIFIRGESSRAEVTETVVLNGTTPVISANTYDVPLTIAKGQTIGALTVLGNSSTVQLLVLPPDEGERKHSRLWVLPSNPGVASDVLVLGKRKILPLMADEDTPLLRSVTQVLIDAASADLFSALGNTAAATEARQKAGEALKNLVNLETRQGARAQRVVPMAEGSYYGDESDWMRSATLAGSSGGGGGSGTVTPSVNLAEAGMLSLGSGVSTAAITFLTEKLSADLVFEYLYVQNTVDPSPLEIRATPSALGTTGFSVYLSAQTDSANYKLVWSVKVV